MIPPSRGGWAAYQPHSLEKRERERERGSGLEWMEFLRCFPIDGVRAKILFKQWLREEGEGTMAGNTITARMNARPCAVFFKCPIHDTDAKFPATRKLDRS